MHPDPPPLVSAAVPVLPEKEKMGRSDTRCVRRTYRVLLAVVCIQYIQPNGDSLSLCMVSRTAHSAALFAVKVSQAVLASHKQSNYLGVLAPARCRRVYLTPNKL